MNQDIRNQEHAIRACTSHLPTEVYNCPPRGQLFSVLPLEIALHRSPPAGPTVPAGPGASSCCPGVTPAELCEVIHSLYEGGIRCEPYSEINPKDPEG